MLSQKIFLRYKEWKGYHPIDTMSRTFDPKKGIKFILAFKENRDIRCECNRENRDRILGIL